MALAVVGLPLLAACARVPTTPEAPRAATVVPGAGSSSAEAASRLLRADREFAADSVARGTPAAFAAYSADAVVNLPANGPVTTTKESLLARLATMGDNVLTWEPQRAEVTDSGEMGFTWGTWAMRQGGAAGPVLTRGKYLNVWRRQADGSWKAVVDIANTATTPVPAESRPTSATPPPKPRPPVRRGGRR